MKLSSLFVLLSLAFHPVSAFGVQAPRATTISKSNNAASQSPLFRHPEKLRAGAVPGWAAYNDALDKKPLITKAMTSLVGWALGDFLTQVRT